MVNHNPYAFRTISFTSRIHVYRVESLHIEYQRLKRILLLKLYDMFTNAEKIRSYKYP